MKITAHQLAISAKISQQCDKIVSIEKGAGKSCLMVNKIAPPCYDSIDFDEFDFEELFDFIRYNYFCPYGSSSSEIPYAAQSYLAYKGIIPYPEDFDKLVKILYNLEVSADVLYKYE